ncbi:porin family protein [Prevotella sp. KH2C16]|uniref:porin family protein n=1 Tax=Prevotella sp. KH2C16 TaxID=1855325 RepID=UPI0008EC4989|nr:porin family protein [Prevotella sp. KH2C16]SFG36346.1 Outer membrane protein beta-barrel domain-containing protein [Prevotella sp. KH2C16]
MKKTILSLLLALSVSGIYAQTSKGMLTLQPRVGLTLGNQAGSLTEGSKIKPGFTVGIDCEYGLSDRWSLSAGLAYAQYGDKANNAFGAIGEENGKQVAYIIKADNVREDLDFLTLPVQANFYVWKGLALHAGLQMGYLLRAHEKGNILSAKLSEQPSGNTGIINFDPNDISVQSTYVDASMKDAVRKFDLGIPMGISYEYKQVVLDAHYLLGLTNLEKSGMGSSRNSVFTFTLGYKFGL